MNYQKNIESLNRLEKAIKGIAGERPFICEIKGRDGKLTKVSKEEFARWMVDERGKDSWVGGVFSVGDKEQIEKPKKSLVYGAKGNIDGTTYYTERKGQDGVFREDYWISRNEEEKRQITERNHQKREAEKSQLEISANQDKEAGDINLNEIANEINQTNTQTENPDKKEINNFTTPNKGRSWEKVVAVSGVLLIFGVGLYYLIRPKKK